ncbi:LysR family transcriptional regulator [Paraburkholderia sp.]|uniref:LysR family transcriptional regulator n=1 Tax=Paraburkholderia sp. TaxID=1926495 RepID=UPI003D6E603F
MHALDWNDLQYVLALARDGSPAAVARRLSVDPTTVGRRIRAVESVLGTKLFERDPQGHMRATDAGETVIRRAEAIEAEVCNLDVAVREVDATVSGSVRITTVPILVNRILVPALPPLIARHAALRIELVADPRDLSLPRRDADIAVRLARPGDDTGERILARKIGTIAYAAYAPASDLDDPRALPWLTYDERMSHLPQAKWIADIAERDGGLSTVAVNDAEALLQAVQAGLGRSLLPCIVADRMPGIVRLPMENGPAFEREVWTLTHPDLRHLARVSVALAWIETSLTSPAD